MTQAPATNVQEVLLMIQNWEYWNEIRLGTEKEYGMTGAEFERLLPEYCKFMGLIARGYTGLAMFSDQVDKMWHAHILNTLRYEQFCTEIFGRMIHHVPKLYSNETEYEIAIHNCIEPEPSCKEPEPDPSCREPDPDPSCREGGFIYDSKHMAIAERFRDAYVSAYGELPGDIWNLNTIK